MNIKGCKEPHHYLPCIFSCREKIYIYCPFHQPDHHCWWFGVNCPRQNHLQNRRTNLRFWCSYASDTSWPNGWMSGEREVGRENKLSAVRVTHFSKKFSTIGLHISRDNMDDKDVLHPNRKRPYLFLDVDPSCFAHSFYWPPINLFVERAKTVGLAEDRDTWPPPSYIFSVSAVYARV